MVSFIIISVCLCFILFQISFVMNRNISFMEVFPKNQNAKEEYFKEVSNWIINNNEIQPNNLYLKLKTKNEDSKDSENIDNFYYEIRLKDSSNLVDKSIFQIDIKHCITLDQIKETHEWDNIYKLIKKPV